MSKIQNDQSDFFKHDPNSNDNKMNYERLAQELFSIYYNYTIEYRKQLFHVYKKSIIDDRPN